MSNDPQAPADDQPPRKMPLGRPWPKGVSGNPAGRSASEHSMAAQIRMAARELTPEALVFLRDAWRNPKIKWTDRITAARAVLGCGHADAVKLDEVAPELTIVVQSLANIEPPPGGCPGVISAADKRWIDQRQRPRIEDAKPVIDVDSKVLQ